MSNSTLTTPVEPGIVAPVHAPGFMKPARPACADAVAQRAAAGLVISPITGETDFLASFIADTFAFPTSEMLDAAAAMFPTARQQPVVSGWHGVAGRGVARSERQADGTVRSVHRVNAGYAQHRENVDGRHARIEIAPGLVRLAYRDEAKAERARDLAAQREFDALTMQHQARTIARELVQRNADAMFRPMALAEFVDESVEYVPLDRGTRSEITSWSRDSMTRLRSTISELDLAPLVSGEQVPAMLTLTLPGDWTAVAPDAATASRLFHNFTRAWADKWGPLVCIWKREFQGRGAPHWHLWLVPPVSMHEMREFNAWCSRTWTRVLFGKQAAAVAVEHATRAEGGKCACSEVCRSLGAGTGVDFAAGLRARDPKRLAAYFLKESGIGEAKAYQNAAPWAWCEHGVDHSSGVEGPQPRERVVVGSLGRFWGYRGIEKAVVSVPVDGDVDVQVRRVLRRWQRAQRIRVWDPDAREVNEVPRTVRVRVQRVDMRTGTVRSRMVTRRASGIRDAGWVAANSGADLAYQIGRWATAISADLWEVRDGAEAMSDDYSDFYAPDDASSGEVVAWPAWAAHGPLRQGGGYPVPAPEIGAL